jgi:hypothetical protein
MRLLKVFAILTTLTAAAAMAAEADTGPPWGPETPHFNLQAVLRPAADGPGGGFGLVKFRQPNDGDKIVYLDVSVRHLAPDASYSLQRATDSNVDDNCTGTNWLTLGQGSDPKSIDTDHRGSGRAALSRSLAVFPVGAQFDIHFRVIDTAGAVVLESGCYQFTVSE